VVRHLLSVVQAGTNDWPPLNSVLANGRSLKRTPSNYPCLPARRYNLTQMIRLVWALNPDPSVTVARQRVPRRYQ